MTQLTLTAKDKTDIIMALRETARGIEQSIGNSLALQAIQAIGIELLVLALKNGPLLDEISGEDAPEETRVLRAEHLEKLIRLEVAAIADTVAAMHERRITESDAINERLTRMFDPTLAFNEAINRAMAAKEKYGAAMVHPVDMTPAQKITFEKFQYPSLMNALANAGREVPQLMVHRIDNDDMADINEALAATPSLVKP